MPRPVRSRSRRPTTARPRRAKALVRAEDLIPPGEDHVELTLGGRKLALTNLSKVFWPELGLTKGDLLRYYASVSEWLLPHIVNRAMVMKRYPNGIHGKFFYMKRAPTPRPDWIETCPIEHAKASVIDFPVVTDLMSLMWLVNLGCIDLHPWYATCDDVQRPDVMHFDLDPGPRASFAKVRDAALVVRDALEALGLPSYVKTSGATGLHVYVPIERGPTQKEVWGVAQKISSGIVRFRPAISTDVYRIAERPKNKVLVDFNQNAFGRTLAGIYAVRPNPKATVSTPLTWEELERGATIDDFDITNVPERLRDVGDLFEPMLAKKGRASLEEWL